MFGKVSIKTLSNIFTLQLSASSAAALDLAHISQTSPLPQQLIPGKSPPNGLSSLRLVHDSLLWHDKRAVTNPNLTVSPPHHSGSTSTSTSTTSGSPTSYPQQPTTSIRPLSHPGPLLAPRLIAGRAIYYDALGPWRAEQRTTPGTPRTPDPQGMNGRLPSQGPPTRRAPCKCRRSAGFFPWSVREHLPLLQFHTVWYGR
jgi:hypothetical protein